MAVTTVSPLRRRVPLTRPLDLRRSLGLLRHGRRDRSLLVDGPVVWRGTRTPEGAVALRAWVDGRTATLHGAAWGAGAAWLLDRLPELCGATDDDAELAAMLDDGRRPAAALLRGLRTRLPGLAFPATGMVTEALVPTVLEQKVTGLQAHRSWASLLDQLGEPAPGPAGSSLGLLVAPPPEVWADVPIWTFHRAGVERKRAATIASACRVGARLDPPAAPDPAAARRALGSLPGVGPWTVAEVSRVAWADADAVSVGDYHVKNTVCWNLAGRARGSDDDMLELLEPYRGQRGRVVRLLEAAGRFAPRFGPKITIQSIEAI